LPNVDSPNGLRPVRTIGGSPYNGSCNRYFVPSTDGTAIYLGQPVKLVGSATADGVSHVTAMTTTADVVCGVVVGVEPDTADSLLYRAASTARYLLVADDPNLLFEIQSDGVGGVAAVGEVADVTGFSGSTSTGRSNMEISNSTITNNGDQTQDVHIVAVPQRPDNDITLANGRYLVRLLNHAYAVDNDGSGV